MRLRLLGTRNMSAFASGVRNSGIETTHHPVYDHRFIWSVDHLPFDAEVSEVASKILQLLEVIAGLPAD